MPRGVKKSDLPTKICQTCGLPFSWRKKWSRDWDQVTYCGEKCRRGGGRAERSKSKEKGSAIKSPFSS